MRLGLMKNREESDQESSGRWKQFVEAAKKAQEIPATETQALDSFLDDAPEEEWKVDVGIAPSAPALMFDESVKPIVSEPKHVEPMRPTPMSPSVMRATKEENLSARFGGKITSALSQGTLIEGKFSFDAPVQVDGTLKGEISATALIVGEHATIEAQCKVGHIVIFGAVRGDIDASETVEIKRGGSLIGRIVSKNLVVEEGGSFEGECRRIRP